jgi:drug/metabolite transporter (DMT)-like permease
MESNAVPAESPRPVAPALGRRLDAGTLWVLASAAGFGAMAIFGKLAYAAGVGTPTLLAVRFSIAAVVLWGLLAARRQPARVSRRTLGGLLLMGGLGYVGQAFAFFTALETIPAATTSLLLYTYPAMVSVLAWLFLRQRITRAGAVALALATLGCALVLGGPSAAQGGGALDPAGVGWALTAAVVYSLYIIAGTPITAGAPPLVGATYIISAAAAVFTGAGLLGGSLRFTFGPEGWAVIVAIALVCTVLPVAAFVVGLARLGPARASILSTVEPLVTIALAALALGERISATQIVGGALILSAVLALQRRPRTAAPPDLV